MRNGTVQHWFIDGVEMANTNLQEGWLAGDVVSDSQRARWGDVVADSQGDGWGRAGRGYARCVGEKMRRAKGFAD
jgi:hypothetical protein